jgi:hypothetical protein
MLPLLGSLATGIIGSIFGGGAAASEAAVAVPGSGLAFSEAAGLQGASSFGLTGTIGPTVANAEVIGGGIGSVLPSTTSAGMLSQLGNWAFSPTVGSQAWSSPAMLGMTGMSLASGLMKSGQAFQDRIPLSKEGEKLQSRYSDAARKYFNIAKEGGNKDASFSAMSADNQAEGQRFSTSQANMAAQYADISNDNFNQRGTRKTGGADVASTLGEAGSRIQGLTAQGNTKRLSQREELINAYKQLANLSNLDNQSAAVAYNSSLAKWNADQLRSAQQGATIGSAMKGMGTANLMSSYYNQMRTS